MSEKIFIGQRFGFGVVISLNRNDNKVRYWNLLCDCGNRYSKYGVFKI
jgi:hypothetical protein